MRCGKDFPTRLGLTLGLLVSTAFAQTEQIRLRDGDAIVGLGPLSGVMPANVNDQGMWVVHVDTDIRIDQDEALLRNGFVTLREGTLLFNPPGARITGFGSFALTDSGDLAMALDLSGLSGGSSNNNGLFFNTRALGWEGGPLEAPELAPGTTWGTIQIIKVNDFNTVVTVGELRKAGAPATQKEDVLVRYQLDAAGNVLSTNVLATKNQYLPALDDLIVTLGSTDHQLAINNRGDVLVVVDALVSAGAILLNMTTVIAQETKPSPVPGRNYRFLVPPKVSLNDFGEYAFTVGLDGTSNTYLVVKNGQKFAQEGDSLPALDPLVIGKGSPAPILITNSGDVFWHVQSNDSSAGINAYMRNYEVIIQESRTVIDGILVDNLVPSPNAFHVSSDGRFWVGRVELQNVGEALIYVDFGLVVPVPGCHNNPGKVALLDGRPLPGQRFRLTMDNGQAVGVLPILLFSTLPAIPNSDCGIPTRFGEVLIRPAARLGRLFGPLWSGQPSVMNVDIPPDLALVDLVVYAQGFFWDVGDQSPAEDFRLTNALRIEVGAP